MTDDALWRAAAAARPGYCTYPPTPAVARSTWGVDDDEARREALAGLGPPLPEDAIDAWLAELQQTDPDRHARILGFPPRPPAASASLPTPAEPAPADHPATPTPPPTAQTRWAARLGALLTRWRIR